jgi:hypothetical protein
MSREFLLSRHTCGTLLCVKKEETAEEYRKRVATAGGHGRAKNLTPKERKESARKAAQARWAKQKKDK